MIAVLLNSSKVDNEKYYQSIFISIKSFVKIIILKILIYSVTYIIMLRGGSLQIFLGIYS